MGTARHWSASPRTKEVAETLHGIQKPSEKPSPSHTSQTHSHQPLPTTHSPHLPRYKHISIINSFIQ